MDVPREFWHANHFFISGCGHSGTSILLALLDNHSAIHAIPGETKLFKRDPLQQARILMNWARMWKGRGVLAEKTPRNVFRSREILKMFPGARIVVISRNPLDNVASLKRRYDDLDRAMTRYATNNHALLQAKKDGYVSTHVHYEHLVVSPEEVLTSVVRHAGLRYEKGMSDNADRSRSWYAKDSARVERHEYSWSDHNRIRNWQVNQPLYDGRGTYEDLLTSREIAHVLGELEDLAVELGYDSSCRCMAPTTSICPA